MSPGGRCESMELDNKILGLIERNTSNPRGVSLGATSSHRSPCSVKVRKTFCFFSIHPSAARSLRRTQGESPWIVSSKALPWRLRGRSEPVQTSLTQSLPVTKKKPSTEAPSSLKCDIREPSLQEREVELKLLERVLNAATTLLLGGANLIYANSLTLGY